MDKKDKRKIEEYKKDPMINFSDSINRSRIGDIRQLTKGDWITRIISSVIVIGILLILLFFKW